MPSLLPSSGVTPEAQGGQVAELAAARIFCCKGAWRFPGVSCWQRLLAGIWGAALVR